MTRSTKLGRGDVARSTRYCKKMPRVVLGRCSARSSDAALCVQLPRPAARVLVPFAPAAFELAAFYRPSDTADLLALGADPGPAVGGPPEVERRRLGPGRMRRVARGDLDTDILAAARRRSAAGAGARGVDTVAGLADVRRASSVALSNGTTAGCSSPAPRRPSPRRRRCANVSSPVARQRRIDDRIDAVQPGAAAPCRAA